MNFFRTMRPFAIAILLAAVAWAVLWFPVPHTSLLDLMLASALVIIALSAALFCIARQSPTVPQVAAAPDPLSEHAALVFENTSEAIFVTDPQANILAVNRAFELVTGFSSSEVLGQNPRFQKSGRHDPAFYSGIWDAIERTGHWQGEVWNRRKNGEIYPVWQNISAVKDEQGKLLHYVSVLADISVLKDAEARLLHLAHHDPLTGLSNRLLFNLTLDKALHRARRQGSRVALLFLDMDRFKKINDSLGHQAGDRLLQEVGLRLKASVRSEDTVSRMGGDEFTVILEEPGSDEDVAHLARKIIDAIGQPVLLDQQSVTPLMSIGIGLYPDDAADPEELVKAADAALYQAKAAGRHDFSFHTQVMTLRANERLSMESDMRQAIERDEWLLHYQPRVDMVTGQTVGLEALLRWRHPVEGLLLPAQFLEVAEQSNLIEPINHWVIREVCRQIAAWVAQGLRPGRVAINVSGDPARYDHIMDTVEQAVRDNGLDLYLKEHAQIELEMPECMLRAIDASDGMCRRLSAIGVGLAIDDFGSGHAPLRLLKNLPLHTLKVDAAFVHESARDAGSRAIAKAIVSMGHGLGLRVMAEGIETDDQFHCARALGCDDAQGFLIGQAVSTEAVLPWLDVVDCWLPKHRDRALSGSALAS